MKRKKPNVLRRALSVILALLITLSVFPVSALADSSDQKLSENTTSPDNLKEAVKNTDSRLTAAAPDTRWAVELELGSSTTLQVNGVVVKSAQSSVPSVAVVKPNGFVTGKKVGTSTVTLTDAAGNNYYCDVTVLARLSTKSVTLAVGDSAAVPMIPGGRLIILFWK